MAISTSSILGITGFTFFTLYILSQILDFYGITSSVYGYYLAFYGFLAISMLVLPTTYSTLSEPSEVNPASSNITETLIKPSAPPLPPQPSAPPLPMVSLQGTPAIPVSQINIL
jgi:hypothetical protein